MHDAAYKSIAAAMNIRVDGFKVQDVKNKIKNLRSKCASEMKEIDDSMFILMNIDVQYSFS